jgi:hypothetical protein
LTIWLLIDILVKARLKKEELMSNLGVVAMEETPLISAGDLFSSIRKTLLLQPGSKEVYWKEPDMWTMRRYKNQLTGLVTQVEAMTVVPDLFQEWLLLFGNARPQPFLSRMIVAIPLPPSTNGAEEWWRENGDQHIVLASTIQGQLVWQKDLSDRFARAAKETLDGVDVEFSDLAAVEEYSAPDETILDFYGKGFRRTVWSYRSVLADLLADSILRGLTHR